MGALPGSVTQTRSCTPALAQTDGTTALTKAVLGWRQSTVELLLDRGADHALRDNVRAGAPSHPLT